MKKNTYVDTTVVGVVIVVKDPEIEVVTVTGRVRVVRLVVKDVEVTLQKIISIFTPVQHSR